MKKLTLVDKGVAALYATTVVALGAAGIYIYFTFLNFLAHHFSLNTAGFIYAATFATILWIGVYISAKQDIKKAKRGK